MRHAESRERNEERIGQHGRSWREASRRWLRLGRVLLEAGQESPVFEAWARFGLMIGIVGVAAVIGVLIGSSVASLALWSELERPYVRGAGAVIGFGAGWLAYARILRTWADDV